jgi:hypothetical protein
VKYDSEGKPIWASQAGTFGLGIAVGNQGDSLVFGETNSGCLIAKLDLTGRLVWERNIVATIPGPYGGVAVEGNGNCYITGSFKGVATSGATTLTSTGTNAAYADIIVAKYDASGNPQWSRQAGGAYFDQGFGIAVDDAGNSYVTGGFSGPAYFSGTVLNGDGLLGVKHSMVCYFLLKEDFRKVLKLFSTFQRIPAEWIPQCEWKERALYSQEYPNAAAALEHSDACEDAEFCMFQLGDEFSELPGQFTL